MPDEVMAVDGALEERLAFETMLSDLSSRFVSIEPAEVDDEITDGLRRVCECLDLDIAALWQLSTEEPGVLRMTHVFRTVEEPPIPEDFDARDYNPWALGKVLEGDAVTLFDVGEAPVEAARDRETWRYFGIKSVFLFPLSTGGEEPSGAMSFHSVEEQSSWSDEVVQPESASSASPRVVETRISSGPKRAQIG